MLLQQIKPQKGKDFSNLPGKTLDVFDNRKYLQSIKYDGNQIFIVKIGNEVEFYTSDWKQFYLGVVAKELLEIEEDFLLVGEFMHDCAGRLGDRTKSAILTTYRTNFNKNLVNGTSELKTSIKVFDALKINTINALGEVALISIVSNIKYRDRLKYAQTIVKGCKYLSTIIVTEVTGAQAKETNIYLLRTGWEGSMLVEPDSLYEMGKRVNHSIKLKGRKTADLLCIDTELGEGKYMGLIGSLVLEDSEGRRVSVGSGLSDSDRLYHEDYYIGKVIEISYEQIMDTYIQPTFIRIRDDKRSIHD